MISFVRLKNFKCFSSIGVPLTKLNLLSGINGMGKSSFLHALLLLRQSISRRMPSIDRLVLNGDLVRLGTAKDVLYEDASEDEEIHIELEFQGDKKHTWVANYRESSLDFLKLNKDREDQAENLDYFEEPLFLGTDFHYLQAERTGPKPFFGISDFDVMGRRQLGVHGENVAYYIVQFGSQAVLNASTAHSKAMSNSLRAQTEAWMSEISPGIQLDLTPYPNIDLVDLRYKYRTGKYVSNAYRSTNVGYGLTYTLPVIVSLLAAPPNSLVIIENPEAHLHPRAQTIVGGLCACAAAGGVQVLVETHSDHVLNGVRLSVREGKIDPSAVALHYFQRKTEDGPISCEVISPEIDEDGRIDNWPTGFFDEWEKSLGQLIRPRDSD